VTRESIIRGVMLKKLALRGVGPAPDLGPLEFAERLNVITGDNGLGKTFLLDVAWWALTGTWTGRPPWPREDATREAPPDIHAVVVGKTGSDVVLESRFDFDTQRWSHPGGRPAMPGLVLYFRVDGRFSLWDPAQHYWKRNAALGVDAPRRPDALHLDSDDVWNALVVDGNTVCRGLVEDWVTWQQTHSVEFDLLSSVLRQLSPSDLEPLVAGEPLAPYALDLSDRRAHPTLMLPYGRTPVVLASSGIKRVLAVAYLLVWAWQGHRLAAQALRQAPERRIVVLFDEPETHLHPQWQRRILPSLLEALTTFGSGDQHRQDMSVQLFTSTHAPLVLASLETRFDEARDTLFHFDLSHGPDDAPVGEEPEQVDPVVTIDPVPFAKFGDASGWLSSPIFELRQTGSVEAEQAIEAAHRWLLGQAERNPPNLRTREQIDARLHEVLGGTHPFWPRWMTAPAPSPSSAGAS